MFGGMSRAMLVVYISIVRLSPCEDLNVILPIRRDVTLSFFVNKRLLCDQLIFFRQQIRRQRKRKFQWRDKE